MRRLRGLRDGTEVPVARAEIQLQEQLAPSLALGLRLVGSFHFLKATILVEYVDYEGNWSNGLSRSLAADLFLVDRGFETKKSCRNGLVVRASNCGMKPLDPLAVRAGVGVDE